MPDFGKLFAKAKDFAAKNPDKVGKGIDKVEDMVDKKTGGKYGSQIDSAGNAAEKFINKQAQSDRPGPDDGSPADQGR